MMYLLLITCCLPLYSPITYAQDVNITNNNIEFEELLSTNLTVENLTAKVYTEQPQDIPGCVKIDTFNPQRYFSVPGGFELLSLLRCFCDNRTHGLDVQCMFGTTLATLNDTLTKVVAAGVTDVHTLHFEGAEFGQETLSPSILHGLRFTRMQFYQSFSPLQLSPDVFVASADSMENFTLQETTANAIEVLETLKPMKNLQNLNLSLYTSTADTTVINATTFPQMPQLKSLSLTQVYLTSVEPGSFASLENLETLDLSSNDINNDIWLEIKSLVNLKVLHLGYTKISEVPADVIQALPNLEELQLERTDIQFLHDNQIFRNSTNLRLLNIKNCLLGSLMIDQFSGATNLQTLLMDNTYISDIPNLALHPDTLANLEILSMSNIDITDLNPNTIKLKSLKFLDLRTLLKLRNIYDDAIDAPNLEVLLLSGSGENFTEITQHMFDKTPKLKYLDLSHSFIDRIDAQSFSPVQELQVLLLNNTQLTTLPAVLTPLSMSLQVLDLSDNTWTCNASMIWFYDWIDFMSNRSTNLEIKNPENFYCYEPYALRGSLFQNMVANDLLVNYTNIEGPVVDPFVNEFLFFHNNSWPLEMDTFNSSAV